MNTKNQNIRWLYLTLGAASLLFAGIIYAWSILKAPLSAEFGWTATALSMNFTLTMCFFCLGGMLGGTLLKKLGFKITCFLSAVLAATGFLIAGSIQNQIGILYLSYGLMSGLGIGMAYNAIISTLGSWFQDKKGVCSGVLMMGFGASALFLGSLADAMIQNPAFGWRWAYRVLGLALGTMLVISGSVIQKPEENEVQAKVETAESDRDISTVDMLKSFTFWKAFLCIVFLAAVGNTVISMARDLALSVGVNTNIATVLVGVLSVCNGLGRIITGLVFDRCGRRVTMISANISAICAAFITLTAIFTESAFLCIIGLCLTGLSYGTCPTISSAFIAEVFGMKHFSMNFPIMNCNLIFASFIATGASLVAGMTGGYAVPFICLLCLSAIAMLLNLSLKND